VGVARGRWICPARSDDGIARSIFGVSYGIAVDSGKMSTRDLDVADGVGVEVAIAINGIRGAL
jgi:hypothetical protein